MRRRRLFAWSSMSSTGRAIWLGSEVKRHNIDPEWRDKDSEKDKKRGSGLVEIWDGQYGFNATDGPDRYGNIGHPIFLRVPTPYMIFNATDGPDRYGNIGHPIFLRVPT